MTVMQLAAVLLALLAAIGWLNLRFVRAPASVAMLGAGVLSAVVLLAAQTAIGPFWGFDHVRAVVRTFDFPRAVLNDMLGLLLFASGMQVDLGEMRRRRLAIWSLATLGVALSTALVGAGTWLASRWLGVSLPLAWALAFGALISPTDPIAVIEASRQGAVSPRLGAVLQCEALFNDGVGFVAFTAMMAFAAGGAAPHPLESGGSVLLEAGGGLALGLVGARAVIVALKAVDHHVLAVTATLALAIGAYATAGALHVSGPIAAASAGLAFGGERTLDALGEQSRRYVEGFWELVDQILNAALFLLLGLQVFVLPFDLDEVGLWAAAVALRAAARLLVVLPWGAFFRFRHEERGASLILTWGGLRGAISLALALTLPHGPFRDRLLAMTFVMVSFSVVVQGLSFSPLARRLGATGGERPA